MLTLLEIKSTIQKGERNQAFGQLSRYLRENPAEKDAWWLMLALVESPNQRIDCYRKILAIDPGDQVARIHLDTLENFHSGDTSLQMRIPAYTRPRACPSCGGGLDIHYLGELEDKWAICPFCDANIGVPDNF